MQLVNKRVYNQMAPALVKRIRFPKLKGMLHFPDDHKRAKQEYPIYKGEYNLFGEPHGYGIHWHANGMETSRGIYNNGVGVGVIVSNDY